MFVCEYCKKAFASKRNLQRHGDCRQVVRVCNQCGGIYKSEGALQRHLKEKHPVLKRGAKIPGAKIPLQPVAKKARIDYQGMYCIFSINYRFPK